MTLASTDRPLAEPIVDAVTEHYWQAARQGVLSIKRCTSCTQPHWYPRPLCPFCLGETEWLPAAGTGTIYSVSVTRRAGPIPYAIAYVALDEGVTLLTNIVDCDLDALRIGQRVKVCFKPTDGGAMVPMFTPA
jgi:uncharacterized OB-fold protein